MKISNNILDVTEFTVVCGEFNYKHVMTTVFIGLNHHRDTPIHRIDIVPDTNKGVVYEERDSGSDYYIGTTK